MDEKNNYLRELAEEIRKFNKMTESYEKMQREIQQSVRVIESYSKRLGYVTTSDPHFNTFRKRPTGEAQRDLELCLSYLKNKGEPVHIDELLTEALKVEKTLRNKNRLSAALCTSKAKADSPFELVDRGTYGLRELGKSKAKVTVINEESNAIESYGINI